MGEDPEAASSGYGWAKRMAELQAKYYAGEHGMEIAIVRPSNAYGSSCRRDDETSHVIPSLMKKVSRGDDPLVVWGSGEQWRNFLHARDFAWCMKLVTERYAKADPVKSRAGGDRLHPRTGRSDLTGLRPARNGHRVRPHQARRPLDQVRR